MDERQSGSATPFNVVAAFTSEARAKAAVDVLTARGVPADAVRLEPLGQAVDETAELRAEMQDEVQHSWGAPAFFMTEEQAKGAFVGTALFIGAGFAFGLLAGLAWAFLVDAEMTRLGRVAITVMVSTAAFATVGFIAGGALKPRLDAASDHERALDDHRAAAERDVLVAVHSPDRETVERSADLLRDLGAERVDLVDGEGIPLPPQYEHPRPADPENWWWRRAGQG
jgi:hypothetical protein